MTLTADKISRVTGYTPEQIAIIKANVAKGTTDNELAYFASVCKSINLNPLNKEVWCYKDKKQNLLIFAGRDGFLTAAQRHHLYNGIRSSEVCENDSIELDIPSGVVHHKIDPKNDRGKIIGAYAIIFRKGGEPTIEWADFKVYNKGFNAWQTHPSDMIKKVAEAHALKKAFGISCVQSEYDYDVKDDVVIPIDASNGKSLLPDEHYLRSQINYLINMTTLEEDELNSIQEEMFEDVTIQRAEEIIAHLKAHEAQPMEDYLPGNRQGDLLTALNNRVSREK